MTRIGSYAFYGCKGVTSIKIPNSVTSIRDYTFYNCAGLTNFVIPSSVTSIGTDAFYGCKGLMSIVIPSSVTSIGGSAFSGCNNLKRVYNCSSLTLTPGSSGDGYVAYYATDVYNNCRLDGDYVITDIDGKPYVCRYVGQETELTLPATYGISDYAFNNYKDLTKITIPNGVKSIGENAFSGCTGLTSFEIPNSMTSIGSFAFDGCTGLTSIEIPNSVTSIGRYAFEDCTGTISINCDIEDAENSNEGWFYGSKFSEVILGEAVNKVGKYAFYGLTSIKSLTIGGNVNRIGYYAFDNCTGLTSIYSNAVTPPACRDNAFHEDTKWDCSLYVPKESIDAYKAANVWKDFLSIKENPYYSSLESIATMDKNDAPLYDLQGTQVVAPRPNGLYIRDGKKIILK